MCRWAAALTARPLASSEPHTPLRLGRASPAPRGASGASHQQLRRLAVHHTQPLALVERRGARVALEDVKAQRAPRLLARRSSRLRIAVPSPRFCQLGTNSMSPRYTSSGRSSTTSYADVATIDLDDLARLAVKRFAEHPPLDPLVPPPRLLDVLARRRLVQRKGPLELPSRLGATATQERQNQPSPQKDAVRHGSPHARRADCRYGRAPALAAALKESHATPPFTRRFA